MADSDSDNTFSWNTKKDFAPDGLDFVTTINSLFGSGQSATLLKNPIDGKLYLYTYTITRTGGSATKGGKYMVSGATNIDQSELFSLTNRQGYLIYLFRAKKSRQSSMILSRIKKIKTSFISPHIKKDRKMEGL